MRICVRRPITPTKDIGREPTHLTAGPQLPPKVLSRYGARMLDPANAVLLAGQRPPAPTAYRSAALLLPEAALRQPDRAGLNDVLSEIGLELVGDDDNRPHGHRRHRSVALRLLPGRPPSTVDAWVALQTLRAAVAASDGRVGREVVDLIGLDHLLVASAFGGAGRLSGENLATEGSGEDGEGGGDDLHPYDGPSPVSVLLPMPTWPSPPAGRRTPVIALLDTGLAPHPWFAADDYLTVADRVQAAVVENSGIAGAGPATITGPDDGPMTLEPLLGGLASHFGHGTFIAGLMRQIAPQARVKAVRIMHSDGVAFESDLICALQAVGHETMRARANEPGAQQVDVVSLSLGYFPEGEDTLSAGLTAEIDHLTSLGIVVVAAAGNYATSRPFLPAALYYRYQRPDCAPLISVGALNPNGSVALFSDEAPWVHYFAPGAAMVSTYPTTARGARQPGYSVNAGHRQGMDRDDFSAGFAVWSGTSFAAGAAAARIAAELYRGGATDPALSLDVNDTAAAVARARAAIAAVDATA
jgi:hypothetical protein